MFRSVKLKNIRMTAFCLTCVLLTAAVCFFMMRPGAPKAVMIHGERYDLRVADEDDVSSFIEACGYEEPELLFKNEITVPEYWNDVYEDYNGLQREQGFDLVPYKGKNAEKLEYAACDELFITVLASDGRIIAAHSCTCDGSEMRAVIQ